jgi:hypothetical protein
MQAKRAACQLFRRAGMPGKRGRSWKRCLKLGRYRTVRIGYTIRVETSKITPPLRPAFPAGLFFCAAIYLETFEPLAN